MVFHAAQRRHVLDAEHEGLVFGRLDLRPTADLHVGRLGVRGRGRTRRWWSTGGRRPPQPFYRATPAEPMERGPAPGDPVARASG